MSKESEISLSLGKSFFWLNSVKARKPDTYKEMLSYADEPRISIQRYWVHIEDMINQACDIYYEDEKLFRDKLMALKVVTKRDHCSSWINRNLFNPSRKTSSINMRTIEQYKKILKDN